MKKITLFLIGMSLLFSACGGDGYLTKLEHRNVDGIDCIVVSNPNSNRVRAIDCNWNGK